MNDHTIAVVDKLARFLASEQRKARVKRKIMWFLILLFVGGLILYQFRSVLIPFVGYAKWDAITIVGIFALAKYIFGIRGRQTHSRLLFLWFIVHVAAATVTVITGIQTGTETEPETAILAIFFAWAMLQYRPQFIVSDAS